jgi:hypothetical protein
MVHIFVFNTRQRSVKVCACCNAIFGVSLDLVCAPRVYELVHLVLEVWIWTSLVAAPRGKEMPLETPCKY